VHGHRDLTSCVKDVNDLLRRGRQQVSGADTSQLAFCGPRRQAAADVGDAVDQTAKRLRDALMARSGPRLNPEVSSMRQPAVTLPASPRPPRAHPAPVSLSRDAARPLRGPVPARAHLAPRRADG
jgi:hypothetical protein